MSAMADFYTTQADKCAGDAAVATLDNVRDRSLRAEAAWRTMADRSLRAQETREADAARKSAGL